jgi:hypothetical protein
LILAADKGWINVGIDHDTAAFAVATIPPLVRTNILINSQIIDKNSD